jgi:hypothetical protein
MGQKRAKAFVCRRAKAQRTACWSHVTQKVEQRERYVSQRPLHNSLLSIQTTQSSRSIVTVRARRAHVQQTQIFMSLRHSLL